MEGEGILMEDCIEKIIQAEKLADFYQRELEEAEDKIRDLVKKNQMYAEKLDNFNDNMDCKRFQKTRNCKKFKFGNGYYANKYPFANYCCFNYGSFSHGSTRRYNPKSCFC